MKTQMDMAKIEKNKVLSILFLFATSILIVVVGAVFSVYSVLNNISFPVMGSSIHGVAFGLVVSFLGIRYFLSVRKLKTEVYKSSSQFSWDNFKKEKKRTRSKNR